MTLSGFRNLYPMAPVVAGLLACSLPGIAQEAGAPAPSAYVSERQLIILKPGQDQVWGSLVMAVMNQGKEPSRVTASVMLPTETTDFSPQEGADPRDVRLADDGGVILEKEFPPGTTLVSIGFVVNARQGESLLTFVPRASIAEASVLTPRGQLQITSPDLQPAADGKAPRDDYDTWQTKGPLEPGKTYEVRVHGVPEGRSRYWFVGGIVGALLFLAGAVIAYKTRPRMDTDAQGSVMIV